MALAGECMGGAILRDARFAFGRARAGGELRVAAVGFEAADRDGCSGGHDAHRLDAGDGVTASADFGCEW